MPEFQDPKIKRRQAASKPNVSESDRLGQNVSNFSTGVDFDTRGDAIQNTVQASTSTAGIVAQHKTAHTHGSKEALPSGQAPKESSARFTGDHSLNDIEDGKETVGKGGKGIKVVKLQQALIDMGYLLPKYGVDGKFGKETREAIIKYQNDAGITESGEFDKTTIEELDKRFDSRSDYVKAAEDFDKTKPDENTRKLPADQKKAALEALKPQAGKAGAKFDPKDSAAYAAEINKELSVIIPNFHKELYADLKDKRKDPKKNYYKDSTLQDAANAGKEVTDKLYGNLNTGPVFTMGDNLVDQWADEEERNEAVKKKFKGDPKGLEKARKSKAKGKVEYLIDSNCGDVNSKYNANPSGTHESTALVPIIESFINTDTKIQTMLDIETGWKGAQLDGTQYLQRFKEPTDEKNRLRLWEMFHVSIHEYIHTLADPKYKAWAEKLGGSEEHTLAEGFCDFFTLNVRAKFPPSSLGAYKKAVEGPFHDSKSKIPSTSDLGVGVYGSHASAERMVGIIGINNAQRGYFQGAVELMGK